MATPTLREAVLHSHASGTSASVTTGAGTAVNDIIITAHGSDFYNVTGMAAPTGTAGITWTLVDTADLGVNNSHMKVWSGLVTSGGAKTITCNPITDEEAFNTTYVLVGANTSTPIDAHASAATDPGASVNHVTPAISPSAADALMISFILTQVFSLTNYTIASMTKQNEDDDSSTFASASLVLSSSGSTGTKTWVADIVSCKFVAINVAVKGAGATATSSAPPSRLRRMQHLLVR